MIHDFENLVTLKKNIAHGLFLDTADQTYVVARWCFLSRLFLDFYWNGVHSAEKYCKAALLLNGYSAKFNKADRPYNHDLEILLAGVAGIAHANLPASLCRSASLQGIHWREESLKSFVQRLNGLGNPNNRYNLFGFVQLPEDMYKLDQAVLAIRNVALNLNNDTDTGSSTANAQPAPTSRLRRLIGSKGLPEVRRAALQHNLVFAPTITNKANVLSVGLPQTVRSIA